MKTRDALKAIGQMGESYDTLIQRLIQDHGKISNLVALNRTLERELHQMEDEG